MRAARARKASDEAPPRPHLQAAPRSCPARSSSPGRSPRSPPTRSRSTPEVAEMIVNRVIDNAAVAVASLSRAPVVAARGQARGASGSAVRAGATVFGIDGRVRPRVGGLGERGRRARARLPRHLPRGRVLAPGRQHPADPRGRPAHRARTARPSCAASPPATRSRSTS